MSFQDESLPVEVRARQLLAEVDGRKDVKRLGAWLDGVSDDALKEAVIAAAIASGVDLDPEEARTWPGKKLLRRAQGLGAEAQVRTTPIHRDEAFTCMFCAREVPPAGRTARDHCPYCLRSRHVDDVVPGDRASTCLGRLDPFEIAIGTKGIDIVYFCTRCRARKVNRAILDGEVPDAWDALVALSNGTLG